MENVSLEVDLGKITGVIRPLHGVNLGPIQMNGWADHSALFKELAFPSVRLHDCPYAVPETVDVHSIFPLFDADAQDPNNYRFAITDDYIQATLDTGAQIVYRLGESIEHHTRRKYFVHPPKDFHKWAAICVNIIRHYNEGWADGFRHGIRYWEIWNEPWVQPLCWTGTHDDYFRLYEITAKAIKAHAPAMKVGGPTAAGGDGPGDFGARFLDHCRRTGAPLDFYSWHLYTLDLTAIPEESAKARDLLNRHGFEGTESHLNEWNYLPAEGWRFNSPAKDPHCIRRAVEEISGVSGAAFSAATLIYMQDCPIDVANFYWARDGFWGLFDAHHAPYKKYHAFKAFRAMLDTPQRVQTSPNEPRSGYAILAGVANASARAGILLANARARETDFVVTIKDWPWSGSAICKRYLLDYDRNLTLVGQDELPAASPAAVKLCLPAPAFCWLTITPDGNDAIPPAGECQGLSVLGPVVLS